MTLRKIAMFAVAMPVVAGFFACNSQYEPNVMTASSVAVKSFSLTKDDSVLVNLDSVYFSIDLVRGLIFNADSLPYGTDVSRLVPIITTLETASAVELNVTRADGTDTTYNYLSNSTDTIDFTNPVTLRVLSFDGLNEFKYTVKVNVHKLVSDSLTWSEDNRSTLPTMLNAPTAQHTAQAGDTYYCLTAENGEYSLATYTPSTIPSNSAIMLLPDWTTESVTFPFTPQIESFTATLDAFYILSDNGELYKSEDFAKNWESTFMNWHAVYGAYTDRILGSIENADGWYVQSYPDGELTPLLDGMPVEGASMPVSYTFPMSTAPQMVIVGGRKADGNLTSATWGYDGTTWANLSNRPLPVALEGVAVASYFSFKTSASWNVTTYPTLVAFGGRQADGELSSTVYTSTDYGCNWKKASNLMQLPTYMPPVAGAQVFVVDSYYFSPVKPSIIKPTETWACPYIYMFGGYDAEGNFQNALWRGVVNRLSFAPIE